MSSSQDMSRVKVFDNLLYRNMGNTGTIYMNKFIAYTYFTFICLLDSLNVPKDNQVEIIKRILSIISEVMRDPELIDFYESQTNNQKFFKYIRRFITSFQHVINNLDSRKTKEKVNAINKKLTPQHRNVLINMEYNGKEFPYKFKRTRNYNELLCRVICFIKFNIIYSLNAQGIKRIDPNSMTFMTTVMNVVKAYIRASLNSIVFSFHDSFLEMKYSRNDLYSDQLFHITTLSDDEVINYSIEGLDPLVFKHMKSIIVMFNEVLIDSVFHHTVVELDSNSTRKASVEDSKQIDISFPSISKSSKSSSKALPFEIPAKTKTKTKTKTMTLARLEDETPQFYTKASNKSSSDETPIFYTKASNESSSGEKRDFDTKDDNDDDVEFI